MHDFSIATSSKQAKLKSLALSIANMSKEVDEEAAALAARFELLAQTKRMNKKEFVAKFGVPGGQSMLSQHLSGNRPISIEAAVAYAIGFGVPLAAISRRVAAQVMAAAKLLEPSAEAPTPAGNNVTAAPFGMPSQTDRRRHSAKELIQSIDTVLARLPDLVLDSARDMLKKYIDGRLSAEQAIMVLDRLMDPPAPPKTAGGQGK